MLSNQANATIVAKGDWLGHLMVIQPGAPGYQDNIVMHDVAGKLTVFDLYRRVHVNLKNDELVLTQ